MEEQFTLKELDIISQCIQYYTDDIIKQTITNDKVSWEDTEKYLEKFNNLLLKINMLFFEKSNKK